MLPAETLVKEGFDFAEIAELAPSLKPDFLIGSSKGYQIARSLRIPLIRVGFPIHDRIGGQRVLHLGYRGAQELYDRIVNALLEVKQDNSDSRLRLPMNTTEIDFNNHPCFSKDAHTEIRARSSSGRAALQHAVQLLQSKIRLRQ